MLEDARQAYGQALVEFRGYYPALACLGKVALLYASEDRNLDRARESLPFR
jgi:hypothetical protein